MSDIANHHAAIAEIGNEIVGPNQLTKTFATAPEKLDSVELPALYTLTGSATNDEQMLGEKEERITRMYRVQVAVVPIGLATPTLRETKCRELLELVSKQLSKHPFLKNTADSTSNLGVEEARVVGDSGIVILPEFGQKYVGFEIRLSVIYIQERAFADGE